MRYTGVSYWTCQPQALSSTALFFLPDFILLIKERLFSITLNQDLFIVQETIHEWPRLPLWPYLFTTCTQHLCCIKLLPDPPSQMLPPCWALAQPLPFPCFAKTCWSLGSKIRCPFFFPEGSWAFTPGFTCQGS